MLQHWGQDGGRAGRPALRASGAFVAVAAGQIGAFELWRAGLAWPSAVWLGAALVALALGLLTAAGPRWAVLALAAALLSGGWFTARVLETPRDSLALALPAASEPGGGSIVTLEGVVVEPVREWRSEGALAAYLPRTMGVSRSFTVRAVRAEGPAGARPVSGRVRVTVRGDEPAVAVGDRVRVTGIATAIEAARNPGQVDPRLWAGQDRLAARLVAASADLVEVLEPRAEAGARAERGWLLARQWLKERAATVLPDEEAGTGRAMLAALLLGERESGDTELRATFARQGLAHVLAISGFHLAVMAGAAMFLVRLSGDRGRLEPVLVAALVVLYVAVLPARAPILRASALVLVWLAAEASGRRYDRRALLAWVAIGVVAVRPLELFSLGYQLTFGITAVLVWFGERVHGRMFPPAIEFERYEPADAFEWAWWRERATRLVSASVLCWLAATPLVAREVGILSPAAAVLTVLVVPPVTALLWASYGAMLAGVVVPPLGAAASAVLAALAAPVLAVVGFFDAMPLTAIGSPRLSLALTAAWTALVLVWLVRGRWRSPGLWAATLVLAGWTAAEWRGAGRLDHETVLRIDTFDVGNGTCHLVRSGGEAVLWDCGSLNPSIGVRTLPRAVRGLGVHRVRDAVITHPNFDHYSGLPDVLEALGVERVWTSGAFVRRARGQPGGAAAACMRELERRGVRVAVLSAGRRFALGEAWAEVLSPPEPSPFAADNDNSLIVRFEAVTAGGARRVLLTGDAQRESLAALMAPGADLRADVLELPHHGSVQPTALSFVDEVAPAVVLQSTGPDRALDVRWNAQRAGRAWWTTATDGASWAEIRRDGTVRSGSARRRGE